MTQGALEESQNIIEETVSTYKELLSLCARIHYANQDKTILFRGQAKEYEIDHRLLRPSLFRRNWSMRSGYESIFNFGKRLRILTKNAEVLRQRADFGLDPTAVVWSVLQHYKICETPFFDVTSSLANAISFAIEGDAPVIYVLGVPQITGALSVFYEKRLEVVDLRKICPPQVSRPHFQEAFFICTYPMIEIQGYTHWSHYSRIPKVKTSYDEFIIARVRIAACQQWIDGSEFRPIDKKILFPDDDRMLLELQKLKANGLFEDNFHVAEAE